MQSPITIASARETDQATHTVETDCPSNQSERRASELSKRASRVYEGDLKRTRLRIDRYFAALLAFEWIAAILAALLVSPLTWAGARSYVHIHVFVAVFLGFIIVSLPIYLVFERPGQAITRHAVAVAQMLMCGLFIQISGGRIETHFLIFSFLAFFTFYRDWRVLITASLVISCDHLLRGFFWPQSVFGVGAATPWRTLEHVLYVLFMDIFLIKACFIREKDLWSIAEREGQLGLANESVEEMVHLRTAQLHESESRLRAMIENAVDGIFAVDEAAIIRSVNPAIERITGFSKTELVGRHAEVLLDSKSEAKELGVLLAECKESAERCHVVPREFNGKTKAGASYPVELTLSPIDVDGKRMFMFIIRDVTERKEMERRVAEFYSMVSHELRTPLTSIRGALGLIEGGIVGEVNSEVAELVTIARGNCERLIRLINDILDLRKIEAGKLDLRLVSLDPRQLIIAALDGIKGMAHENQVELSFSINRSAAIWGDRDRLIQVLTNLVSNAIKFSTAGDCVHVSVDEGRAGTLKFAVEDNGPGIAAEHLPKLFGKFQQIDSSDTRPKEGTGLGLAISKAIIERHGGTIGCETAVAEGSKFWFEVGCAQSSSGNRRMIDAEQRTSGSLRADAPTVLIVEDDPSLSLILEKLLAAKGYATLSAGSMAEAEEQIVSQAPSAVILDLSLPDGDGLDLLKSISKRQSPIPVIVLTGRERETGFSSPALVDWLTKPYDADRLAAALKRATSRPHRHRVLLVEDDDDTRLIVSSQLRTLGIECLQAADGAEGLSLARASDPDLIVLDLGIPRPDGFELVSMLRQERAKDTPLLVYTGQDLGEDEIRQLSLGMTHYLTKATTSIEEFLEAVRGLLDGSLDRSGGSCAPSCQVEHGPGADSHYGLQSTG